ncbi:MAG TPA: PGPGW domain-containing protein [Acidimicrobiales bacterium]
MHPIGTLLRFIWRSSRRAAVFMVGITLLAVGFVMFVTPGPGIVLVVAGLAVLATEFAWAEHLLDTAKEQAARAGQSAQRVPGVTAVTSAAGRLVPRRWRTVTATQVTVTTDDDGVMTAERTVISATTVTVSPDESDDPPFDVSDGTAVTDQVPARIDAPAGNATMHDGRRR